LRNLDRLLRWIGSAQRRSPGADWTLKSRVQQLDPAERDRFWLLSPDLRIAYSTSRGFQPAGWSFYIFEADCFIAQLNPSWDPALK
jgi:hypothetical protein